MAQKLYEESNIQAIANAIRGKNGLTTTYKVSEMAAAITAIEGGGSTPIEPPVGDGKTRIYIHLEDGRLSPVLGICPNGTVTVDWGDGTESNTLTGTSLTILQYTPAHNYAAAGDYVISLTVDGSAAIQGLDTNSSSCLLGFTTTNDNRNRLYQNSIYKIEFGEGIEDIKKRAFSSYRGLYSVILPKGMTIINSYTFQSAYCLRKCVMSDTINQIGTAAFDSCYSLSSIIIPKSVIRIDNYAFYQCTGMKYYDFTAFTAIPRLSHTDSFSGIPADCEIRVPAALADEWKAATNWATYANKIVGV